MQEMYRFSGEPEILTQERLEIAKEYFAGGVHFIDGFLDFYQQYGNTIRYVLRLL